MPASVLAVAAALLAGSPGAPLPTVDRPVVRVERVVLVDGRGRVVTGRDLTAVAQRELQRKPSGAACHPIVVEHARDLRRPAAAIPWREAVPSYVIRGRVNRSASGVRVHLAVPAYGMRPLAVDSYLQPPGARLVTALRFTVRSLVDRICAAHRDEVATSQTVYLQDVLRPLAGDRLVGTWITRDRTGRAVGVGVAIVAPTPAERARTQGLGGLPVELVVAIHTEAELLALAREVAVVLGIPPVDVLLDLPHDGLIARLPWARLLALTPEERAALEAEGTRRGVRLTLDGAGPKPPVPGFPVWQRAPADCPQTGRGMVRRTGLSRPDPAKEHFLPQGAVRAIVCLYTRGAPRTPAGARNGTALVASGEYPAAGLPALLAALEALPRYAGATVYCIADGRGDALDGAVLVSADGGTYPVALRTRALNPGENPACGEAVGPGGSRVLGDDYTLTRLLFAALGRSSPV